MPSKPQVMNNFKALSQESNVPMGDNSMRREQKNSDAEIYIGNIAVEASRAKILKFLGDVNIISFRLLNKSNKVFGFANFQEVHEAEKAVEMFHNKNFMGHKLVVRLANSQNKKPEILPQMPKLEDIEDDDCSESASDTDDKFGNSKTISAAMSPSEEHEKNYFEDVLNIQPDSSGLFSLCINRKDSYLRSKHVIEKIFCPYGSVSSMSIIDDTIVVKMPSKQQAINSFKVLGQELNMSIGGNSVDSNTVERTQNKISGSSKIYIGNISMKASREKLLKFFDEVRITYFKLLNKSNKVFAFANFPDMREAERAVEIYHNKVFMGNKLVVRLADDRSKKTEVLPEMPKLEDIQDDDCSESTSGTDYKIGNSKMISATMPRLEDINAERNSPNKIRQSHCKYNNKSANRKFVNDWMSSQDNIKHNGQLTDVQDHVTLFVGNFPYGMSQEQLLSLFQDFHALNVNIINNHRPKRSTQALVDFPNQKEAEKAINMFDKASYQNCTLLVTSTGFCPCHDNQKSYRKNKASSSNHSLPAVNQCNGSSSLDKKLEHLDISCSAKQQYQQQLGRNCQQTNSSPCVAANKKPPVKSPKNNRSRNKKLSENNLQMEEENQPVKIYQIDEPFKAEAAKMAILVKHFQIQPSLGSCSDISQIMITSVINNELFWGNIFSSSNSDLTDFMVLHNELQSVALSWPKYVLSKKEMKCVALYQGEWYRAWVLNSVEKDVVEVFFLDYGNISQINLNDVRSSEESIWKLLPKARAFRIDVNSEKLPSDAENKFFDIKICKPGSMANGFISIAALVSH